MGYFVHDATRVWLAEVDSGHATAAHGAATPARRAHLWVPFPRRVRVLDFRPLGAGLFTDGRRVFFGDEVVDDIPPPDPASLRACADSDLPHHVAVDRHGPFGNFECGGIIRLRR
jgi:hypothetical protein